MQFNSVIEKLGKLLRGLTRTVCVTPRCLFTYSVHGLIMVIPLAVTIWVIAWLFNTVDGILAPTLTWVFGYSIPGLGFAIIIFSLILIGYFGIKVGHKKSFGFFEARIIKFPLLGAIYGGTKQVVTSFTTSTNSGFMEVVFLEFPRKGIYTLGLVTAEVKDKNGSKILNVFIPTAPNPVGGFLQIVPESDVIRTTMSVSEAMKLIISAGKVTHDSIAEMLLRVPESHNKGEVLKLDS